MQQIGTTRHNFSRLFFSLFIFILLHLSACFGGGQRWDGVAVTESNFLALQAFKQELVDPNGFLKSWNDSRGGGYGACSGGWAGIKCAQGQVIVIQLPWKGLRGAITERIGQLQGLRKLSLHDNRIGGSIPSSLGLLQNLRGLQLFNNKLTGPIPPSLGHCPLLQSLDLSGNLLSGKIPDSFANSAKLYRLNLSFNSFSGSIPSGIGTLSRLESLDFSNNHLGNQIPEALGNLSNLSVMILSRNELSGRIPVSIGEISALTRLDLSLNNLSGEIPLSFDTRSSLSLFNVSYNSLSGPVPATLAERFNSSSFVGNVQLCGYSPLTQCSSPAPSEGVLAPPPEASKKRRHRKLSSKDKILIATGALLVALITLSCILLFFLIRSRATSDADNERAAAAATVRTREGVPPIASGEIEAGDEAGGKLVHFDGPIAFTADDLLCAMAEIMGKSTYGTVYKATLEDGSEVAVKRLREKITKTQREFEPEVGVLGRIRHPNLLALRSYYLGPKGEKLLVFDYMPKGSLTSFLHARVPETSVDWPTRMKIAQGIARGLRYLHTQENIIHGNLTSNNVLLDENKNPKVADYGLSRLMTAAVNSNVIATAGVLGYRAPELSKLKKAGTKTDIYSLGVILLELLTGKLPGETRNGLDLPQWVASAVKEEWTNEVFDGELMRDDASSISDELLNTLKLALHCVDPSPSARPEVQQVLQQLEEIRPERSVGSGD